MDIKITVKITMPLCHLGPSLRYSLTGICVL